MLGAWRMASMFARLVWDHYKCSLRGHVTRFADPARGERHCRCGWVSESYESRPRLGYSARRDQILSDPERRARVEREILDENAPPKP